MRLVFVLLALCSALLLRRAAPQLSTNVNDVLYPANSLEQAEGNLYPLGGLLPSPRLHHSLALVEDLLVVYGGYDKDGALMDDVNIYDTNIRQWSGPILKNECCNLDGEIINTMGKDKEIDERGIQFTGRGSEGDVPLARAEHDTRSTGPPTTCTRLIRRHCSGETSLPGRSRRNS